jgi:hypothetical protein
MNQDAISADRDETSYVPCRLVRSTMRSYTPPLTTSFFSRRSGPLSGRIHTAPVDDISRSVAAKMMVPPTRSIGRRGIPAVSSLFSSAKRAVSVRLGKVDSAHRIIRRSRTCEEGVNDGYPNLLLCQWVGHRSSQSQNRRLGRRVYWTI